MTQLVFGNEKRIEFLAEIPYGKTDIPMLFGNSASYFERCRSYIGRAEKVIRIASPFVDLFGAKYISDSYFHNRMKPLLEVLVRKIDDEALLTLTEQGFYVYILDKEKLGWGFHAKYFVFDDEICVIGSSNLTERNMFRNFEAGIMLNSNEIEELVTIHKILISFGVLVSQGGDRHF